eukprot:m.219865 g.219865  ORF g.219865 m.219865 type:complete len:178 (+) comp26295_c1_seq3:723-1256(+)
MVVTHAASILTLTNLFDHVYNDTTVQRQWHDEWNNSTALIWATSRGNAEVVALLLQAGADTSLKTKAGKTVLDVAQRYKKHDIVALLTGCPSPAKPSSQPSSTPSTETRNLSSHPAPFLPRPSRTQTHLQQEIDRRDQKIQELEASLEIARRDQKIQQLEAELEKTRNQQAKTDDAD